MMDSRLNKFSCALGNIDSQYIEEALCFNPRTKILWKKRGVIFPKMSAACLILLIILGFSLAVFALSKMTISWRDIFSPNQNIINDADEAVIESQQTKVITQFINSESEAVQTMTHLNDVSVEDIEIDIIKAISDERALYLLYSVKANDGALLNPEGRFKSFDMFFSGKMMSGAYQQYFIERHEGIPENELEGVIYADWQYDLNIGELALNLTDWQEEKMFNDIVANVDIADIVANSEGNLHLPMLYTGHKPE